MLEVADKENLLLENLLKKSESNCELEPQVNELYFNSFDEEMRFLKECIGKDAVVKDSVNLNREMGVFPSNHKRKYNLLQHKGFVKPLLNEGNISIRGETTMYHRKVLVIVEEREKFSCLNDEEKTIENTFGTITVMKDQNSNLIKDAEAVSQRNWKGDKGESNEYCTEFRK